MSVVRGPLVLAKKPSFDEGCNAVHRGGKLGGIVATDQLARADGLSWAEAADLLGTTRASAWQRFSRTDAT